MHIWAFDEARPPSRKVPSPAANGAFLVAKSMVMVGLDGAPDPLISLAFSWPKSEIFLYCSARSRTPAINSKLIATFPCRIVPLGDGASSATFERRIETQKNPSALVE
ncbi:hypothetical protein [Mesorhizobium loti]|uniref:hypothetical protein n=1 Tax=Rhizobium loti TaxID=381 RepID=UPI0012BC0534|nr:hypothetical protein [Mesorhizobium loti]